MKAIKLSIAAALAVALSSCATIAGDNTRQVSVNSEPAGAKIFVDGQQYGVTPATITLPNYIYGGKTVTLRKKGYSEQAFAVNSKFQPVALFDILAWPTFLIDGATGNLVKIDPANRHLKANLSAAA